MRGPAVTTFFSAVLTLLGLQSIRLFTTGLVWVVGETSDREVLLLLALAAFASAGLAWALVRGLGWRRTVIVCSAGLALARVADQSTADPVVDVLLGAAGTAFFGWVMATYIVLQGRYAGIGLAGGMALDVAVRTLLITVDAPMSADPAAFGITVVAAAAAVTCAWYQSARAGPPAAGGPTIWTAVAIPSGLALFMLAGGNLGQVAAAAGLDWRSTAAWVTAGALAGLAWAPIAATGRLGLAAAPSSAMATIAGFALLSFVGMAWGTVLLGAGLAGLMVWMPADPSPLAADEHNRGAGRPAAIVMVGLILLLVFVFTFYSYYSPGWVPNALIAVAVGAGILGAARSRPGLGASRSTALTVVVLALLTATPAVISTVGASAPGAPLQAEPRRQVRVLSYNIRQGFGIANRWDLEAVAREIERHQPDVVVLQEVGRGWVIGGMADQLLWLSKRLDMAAHFGSNIGDLWGNAALTKLPASARNHRFDNPGRVPRGALELNLPTVGGGMLVVVTHLDHQDDGAPTRLDQLDTVLGVWNGQGRTLIMGDFNAKPDSEEYAKLAATGLRDLVKEAGNDVHTYPASAPVKRIDYAFGSPDLQLIRAEVPASLASDHLPVLVEVAVP